MKTIKIKTYQFSELSESAKEKAIETMYDINVDYEWWEPVYMDAENVGIKITGFDIDRGAFCEGNFINSALETAKKILENHGESCETYKTALHYKDKIILLGQNEHDDDRMEELEQEFLHDILEYYRIILQKEYEYQTSKEAIIDTIEANEYEFTKEGKRSVYL